MPRKKINRSQAIRDYLAKNAGASVSEIKEALAKKGIKASDSLINAVKYRKPGRKGKRRRGRRAGAEGCPAQAALSARGHNAAPGHALAQIPAQTLALSA
jgi:hypothetical protein